MMTNAMTNAMLMGLLVIISLALLVAGLVLIVIWVVRRSSARMSSASPGGSPAEAQEPPLTILQRRYARGEIAHDEYERMRSNLMYDADRPLDAGKARTSGETTDES